jgi:hypothetical protein
MPNRILVFLSSILGKFPAGFGRDFLFLAQILFSKKSRLVSSLVFFAKYIVSLPL